MLDPRVLQAMLPYMSYEFGNPGSMHAYGRTAADAVLRAREQVAAFLKCDPEQLIFTSGGTEGNNTVFAGLEGELRRRDRRHVLISGIEHDSVWKSAFRLNIKSGFDLRICPPDTDGIIKLSEIEKRIDEKTGLVSVMLANNETGMVNDAAVIGEFCHARGILYHTDAVQAAGIIPIDLKDGFSCVDFLTVSSHKLNGPKGVGALFARDPHMLSPLIVGGDEQEFGLRGGTENVPGIVGFGKACELADAELATHFRYLTEQHGRLISTLKSLAEQKGIALRINGDVADMSPKTLNVCFPGIDAQTLLLMLDARQVYLSAGSACRAHEDIPSRTLTAMGLSEEDARSSIRISLSHLNPPGDIDTAAHEIIDCAATLSSL